MLPLPKLHNLTWRRAGRDARFHQLSRDGQRRVTRQNDLVNRCGGVIVVDAADLKGDTHIAVLDGNLCGPVAVGMAHCLPRSGVSNRDTFLFERVNSQDCAAPSERQYNLFAVTPDHNRSGLVVHGINGNAKSIKAGLLLGPFDASNLDELYNAHPDCMPHTRCAAISPNGDTRSGTALICDGEGDDLPGFLEILFKHIVDHIAQPLKVWFAEPSVIVTDVQPEEDRVQAMRLKESAVHIQIVPVYPASQRLTAVNASENTGFHLGRGMFA